MDILGDLPPRARDTHDDLQVSLWSVLTNAERILSRLDAAEAKPLPAGNRHDGLILVAVRRLWTARQDGVRLSKAPATAKRLPCCVAFTRHAVRAERNGRQTPGAIRGERRQVVCRRRRRRRVGRRGENWLCFCSERAAGAGAGADLHRYTTFGPGGEVLVVVKRGGAKCFSRKRQRRRQVHVCVVFVQRFRPTQSRKCNNNINYNNKYWRMF